MGGERNRKRRHQPAKSEPGKGSSAHFARAARLLAGVTVLALLGVGTQQTYRWALRSPLFSIQSVIFHGAVRTSDAELGKASGIVVGQNIFQLEIEAIARGIASNPWVKADSISIRRRWPSEVEINLEEHRPVAMVSLGELYLLDQEGTPFKKVQAEDRIDLPLVTGVPRDEYMSHPRQSAAQFVRAVAFATAYDHSAAATSNPLSEVRIEKGRISLITGHEGQKVLLGEEGWTEKLIALSRVRSELNVFFL